LTTRPSKDKHFTTRKSIVLEALERGIKPTAFRLNMSKNTIRLWLRRFQREGNDGLTGTGLVQGVAGCKGAAEFAKASEWRNAKDVIPFPKFLSYAEF
jgi:transposase-like protein